MDKKTQRKNRTNLQVVWPSEDEYWTIRELNAKNKQFVEITLRVRVSNAIKRDNTVAVIGDKMNAHGRPEMVCAVRQANGKVKQSTVEAARAAGIRCNDPAPININPVNPGQTAPVNLNPTASPTSAPTSAPSAPAGKLAVV